MVTPLIIAQLPDERKMQDYARMVGEKDAHVIGACLAIGASFSLTLDKRLELQINRSNLPVYALTPGEFIKTVLPKHVDYD